MSDGDPSEDALDAAGNEYERVERHCLDALAAGVGDAELGVFARRVADAARAYDVADNARIAVAAITPYYDAPEVLSTLWADVAAAYEQRTRSLPM